MHLHMNTDIVIQKCATKDLIRKCIFCRQCNGYGNIFTILPALAVGCTGKGRVGISGRLHWAITLGLGTVSTLELHWP